MSVEDDVTGTRIAFCIAPVVRGEDPPVVLPSARLFEILLRIYDNAGNVMVDVMPDGRVTLGEHYHPDITARRFWSTLTWIVEREHP